MAEAPTYTSLATEANKTIRISNIPISISRTVLQKCLQDQLDKRYGTIAKDNAGNLYISLAPDASAEDCQRFQVATVTFSGLVAVPSSVNLGPPGGTFEGTVDTHFRGLTQLNNPEDPEIDIIAVTGLAGHAFGSWRSRERPGMWLRDLLPKDMEDNGYMARVLTYGYDTTLNGSHSYAGVNDHSKQFLEAVKGARTMDPTRPLILIGHSLGGLIIKEAIVMSFEEGQGSTLRSCCGMLLFAVPHKGLAEAGLIGMVRGQSNEKLVQSLCGEGPYLSDLDQSFVRQITSTGIGPNIISFYETKDTRTVKISSSGKWERSGSYVRMVTKESVKHAAENSQLFSTDADHSSIVKFRNRSDQDYQFVRRKLLEIAGTIPTAPTEGEGTSLNSTHQYTKAPSAAFWMLMGSRLHPRKELKSANGFIPVCSTRGTSRLVVKGRKAPAGGFLLIINSSLGKITPGLRYFGAVEFLVQGRPFSAPL
ncbi:hypothetical protein DFP73DRAFT_613959 [Morchella snyderi]|nr:hypothetical protein DFP73DRAFT_613959 [Morchella snyderi]